MMGHVDHDKWLPAKDAPGGRWLLVRTTDRDESQFPRHVIMAVRLGGLWWMADHHNRELVPLALNDRIEPALDPDWRNASFIFMHVVGPRIGTTRIPEEYVNTSDGVMEALPNAIKCP